MRNIGIQMRMHKLLILLLLIPMVSLGEDTMNVRMPDGTVIKNVPKDIKKDELLEKYERNKKTVKVEMRINQNEQLWECKAPSGNTYYVKLEKGKNYSITEVCNAFVNQARRDFPDLVEYVSVPIENSPRVSPELLPLPCGMEFEGYPCIKEEFNLND